MIVHLKGNFKFTLKTDSVKLQANADTFNHLKIGEGAFFMEIFPESSRENAETSLPYFFTLTNQNNYLKTDCQFVKLTKINNEHYLLEIDKNTVNTSSVKPQSMTNSLNQTAEITAGNTTNLKIDGNTVYTFFHPVSDSFIYLKSNIFVVLLENRDFNQIICLQNDKVMLDQKYSTYKDTEDGFQILTEAKDIVKHGIVQKFSVQNDQLSEIENFTVYMKSKPKKCYSLKALPICFFESIKTRNWPLCKSYLDEELSYQTAPEHFETYFGSFEEVLPLNNILGENIIGLTHKDGEQYICKNYKVTMKGSLIANISQIL